MPAGVYCLPMESQKRRLFSLLVFGLTHVYAALRISAGNISVASESNCTGTRGVRAQRTPLQSMSTGKDWIVIKLVINYLKVGIYNAALLKS